MQLPYIAYSGFDVVSLQGDMNMSVLPSLSPLLSNHIQDHSDKNLVLDLSEVTAVDSSALRLLLNIKKRLETSGKKLSLLRPGAVLVSLLKDVNLDRVFNIIDDSFELQQRMDHDTFETFRPYTRDERGLRRLRCTCPICGSLEVAGYVVDSNAYSWYWEEDDLFPACSDKSGEPFDYFGSLPLVCLECYMSSIHPEHWNVLDKNGQTILKSALSDSVHLLLSKSMKKRKRMMENEIIKEDAFFYPRDRLACYQSYLLADVCSRMVATNKNSSDPFEVGYLNYLAIKYADPDEKEDLIGNCRTWLTQALHQRSSYSFSQISKIYFILFAAALTIGKTREATRLFLDFGEFMKKSGHIEGTLSLDNPAFWYTQAEVIWHTEINAKTFLFKHS